MANYVEEVNSSNFDELVLKSDVPVVVDFWAPWCGPCATLAPILEEIATGLNEGTKEDESIVKFFKINIDDNEDIVKRYKIKSIPTVIIFENGKETGRGVGELGAVSSIRRLIVKLLGK